MAQQFIYFVGVSHVESRYDDFMEVNYYSENSDPLYVLTDEDDADEVYRCLLIEIGIREDIEEYDDKGRRSLKAPYIARMEVGKKASFEVIKGRYYSEFKPEDPLGDFDPLENCKSESDTTEEE